MKEAIASGEFSSMAQNQPYKPLDEEKRSASKKSRCSTTYVQIACQISCIVLLIICVVSIERRLAFLERRIDSIAEEIKKPEHKGSFSGEGSAARDTFSTRESMILSSLTKKVRTLESR